MLRIGLPVPFRIKVVRVSFLVLFLTLDSGASYHLFTIFQLAFFYIKEKSFIEKTLSKEIFLVTLLAYLKSLVVTFSLLT